MKFSKTHAAAVFTLFLVMLGCCRTHADMLTTLFDADVRQSGNMFDIEVLNPNGLQISAFDLNLVPGNWDVNLYTLNGSYVGNENSPDAWTLHDSINGLISSGTNNPTFWDFEDLMLDAGNQAFYVEVTNGFAMAYSMGTAEGGLVAGNDDLLIFEGTGNVFNFGNQFRPRIWNGTIYYQAIPEPGSFTIIAGMSVCLLLARRRRHR